MKVARLYSYHDIRIEEMPVPEVGPHEALIRTKACGICSGDVMQWYIEKKAPLVLGHEPAGEIIETGKKVVSFKRGEPVFVHHHAPCFVCRYCKRGDYVHCPEWRKTGITPGGVSEYILVSQMNLENDTLVLPEPMSYEDGTLIEPVACVVKALKRAHIKRGDTVLVIGLGVMGQIHVLLAGSYGAGKIIGADMVPYRLNKATEMGADAVVDVKVSSLEEAVRDLTKGEMADIVVVGPNSAAAMKEALSLAGKGGSVLFFTPSKPGEKLVFDPNRLYFSDINIITSYSCGPADTADALELIAKGTVTARKLVTHRFPIEKTREAFKLTAEAKESLKSLIVFE